MMKQININQLQNQISKVMKEVEAGEIYQVSRYSKPVAFLLPKEEFESAVSGSGCKKCMEDLRRIANANIPAGSAEARKNQNAK
ncbi:MAG: type II toxin-antitoxin system prevent-host-death family antitoxin [Candidatus Berkelbacteria bacterium]|nr:type II toxin-antitoxin system prevent-host-death family antitoxin [Candidatus Berkelbacteria bacterium]